jgi:hypothetical protein
MRKTGLRIVGCDAGVTGALATFEKSGLLRVDDMPPVGEGASVDLLHPLLRRLNPDLLVLERAGAPPYARGTIKLGMAYQAVRNASERLDIPMYIVAPTTWKSYFGLSADKDESRRLATLIWPNKAGVFRRKQDHNRAEAALIAAWGLHHVKSILFSEVRDR